MFSTVDFKKVVPHGDVVNSEQAVPRMRTALLSKLHGMPKAYSPDLRWRAVWLVLLQNKSISEVSRLL